MRWTHTITDGRRWQRLRATSYHWEIIAIVPSEATSSNRAGRSDPDFDPDPDSDFNWKMSLRSGGIGDTHESGRFPVQGLAAANPHGPRRSPRNTRNTRTTLPPSLTIPFFVCFVYFVDRRVGVFRGPSFSCGSWSSHGCPAERPAGIHGRISGGPSLRQGKALGEFLYLLTDHVVQQPSGLFLMEWFQQPRTRMRRSLEQCGGGHCNVFAANGLLCRYRFVTLENLTY